MFLLYLDDSGSVANRNEEHFVLGGVCVFERRLHWINNRLEDIAKEIQPDNPWDIEFHASEIFGRRREPWKRLTREQAVQTLRKVLLTLADEHETSVVFACAVHKASFPNQDPVELAFEDLISRFDRYLRRLAREGNEQRGLIILDKSAYETSLQRLALTFKRTGTRWGSTIHNVNEVPLFVDSKASRLIQLADHIAYAVFRRYESSDLAYFNCIEGRFDSENGRIHGLVHKQFNNRRCTCPACMSRTLSAAPE